ncbi:3'-5' exonuclease [Hymenobacter sp. BT175]|uniref:3'-5' exonuclease n=1 Tax=Hymenobacter translucens TaxID=2886507 RepID=UPI001D0E8339|nr:3'-5' exonuclease [Hymenobacter translucens]MCC2546487.1 3'-5' exonuclease [Hymenobacter translucens]
MEAAITRALATHSFTAIDFETANELRSSACAIGVVQVREGQITDTYQTLLRPRQVRVSGINYSVHGIAEADLHGAPTLAEVWEVLRPHLHEQLVVAHNSAFDVSVLEHSCRDFGLPVPLFHCMCSVKLAKAAWPHLERHRLNHLADYFGLPLNHHDALSDAVACAEVTLRALRSGLAFPFSFKQRELTAGLAARLSKQDRVRA